MTEHCDWDLIIIGAGAAGLTAGIYAARDGLRTVIIERFITGGQVAVTSIVENYPGFDEPVNGAELAERMRKQAERFGATFQTGEATGLNRTSDNTWTVQVAEKKLSAHAVIIATGASHKKLGIPGEDTFWGRGISCCATCDGPIFRDREVIVIGGGNTAVQESLHLRRFAKKITIVHRRDRLRASRILQDQLMETPDKVSFCWNSVATRINGTDHVESVTVRNVVTEEERDITCDGVFLFVGLEPNTAFAVGTVKTNDAGYVLTDETMTTSASGIYACGDARKRPLRQIVTACGEAAVAAYSANHYVGKLKGTAYE